jgi:hypothetical protein
VPPLDSRPSSADLARQADTPPDPLALALRQLARGAETAAARCWARGLLERGERHGEGGRPAPDPSATVGDEEILLEDLPSYASLARGTYHRGPDGSAYWPDGLPADAAGGTQ